LYTTNNICSDENTFEIVCHLFIGLLSVGLIVVSVVRAKKGGVIFFFREELSPL